MKQVILDGYLVNPGDVTWAGLEQFGPLTVYDTTPKELVIERIGDAEHIYANRTVIDAEVIHQCPRLRYIGLFSTGYNLIDIAATREAGITVCNVPSYSTHAVAQTTVALLLQIVNGISQYNDYVKSGRWIHVVDKAQQGIPLIELRDKTIGIVGMGEIGNLVGDICAAMGMQVLAYRRHPQIGGKYPFVPLDELLAASDVVSLHCPLTDSTRGMVNREFIAKMKNGAILLNTARGPVLDEQAVSDALDSGKLFFAGVDVLSAEPPKADNPLVRNSRCIITPHIAWAPKDTRIRLLEVVVSNVQNYLAGHPANVVNGL